MNLTREVESLLEEPPGEFEARLISVVVPVFNEGENITSCLRGLWGALKDTPHEILICYDFEADTTLPAIKGMRDCPKTVRLVKNDLGKGVVNALRAGFNAARGDVVVTTMADLSDPPDRIVPMAVKVRAGNAVVSGSRYMRGGSQHGGPFVKRTLSRVAGLMLAWVGGMNTHDATTNFRAYSRKFLNRTKVESRSGFEIALELTSKAHNSGQGVDEVPSTWTDRTAGESRFKLMKWLPGYLYWFMTTMWQPLVVWLVLASVSVHTLRFVAKYSIDLPMWDEIEVLPYLLGQAPVTLEWLWAQHNEHRIALSKLVYVGMVSLFGYDLRSANFVSVALLIASAWMMLVAARRLRGRMSWVDLFFPLSFCSIIHWENLTSGFQLAFTLVTFLVSWLTFLLIAPPKPGGLRAARVLLAGVPMILLTLTGGAGVLTGAVVGAWMLVEALRVRIVGQKKTAAALGFVVMVTFCVVVAYFVNFNSAARAPIEFEILVGMFLRGAGECLTTPLGAAARHTIFAVALAGLTVATAGVLCFAWWSRPAERFRAGAMLALLAAVCATVLSIGLSRGPMGEGWGWAARYVSLTVPLTVLAYLAFNHFTSRRWNMLVPVALVVCSVGLTPQNVTHARLDAEHRLERYRFIKRDVRNGLPVEAIASRHAAYMHPTREAASRVMLSMYNKRIGPFKNPRPLPFVDGIDPRRWTVDEMTVEEISPVPERTANVTRTDFGWVSQGTNPQFAYHIGPASHVAAVRFTFVLNRSTDAMSWPRVDWADSTRSLGYAPQRSISLNGIRADPGPQTLTVWVWDHADYVRLSPVVGESIVEIQKVEILRKPPEPEGTR